MNVYIIQQRKTTQVNLQKNLTVIQCNPCNKSSISTSSCMLSSSCKREKELKLYT